MYRTENRTYNIVIKDVNGDVIAPQKITDMRIVIYHDTARKKALSYKKVLDGTEDGPILMDGDGHKFDLLSTHTENLIPGRYIIQIRYDLDPDAVQAGEDRISISDRELFILKPVIE